MSSDLHKTSFRVGLICEVEDRREVDAVAHALDLYGGLPASVRDQLAIMQAELTEAERRWVYSEIYDAVDRGLRMVRDLSTFTTDQEDRPHQPRSPQ